ncbi:MAG: SDR family oxidoreductase, partial [Pseudomonadota bacterium]
MPSAELKGKVAWITGGGSGIGLAGALELAKAGAHVVISGRTERTNQEGLSQIKKFGDADAIQLDVSDKKAVAATAANIEKRHGRIDILVNSAGTNLGKRSFQNMSVEGWDEVVAINLNGLFYCCQAVIPGMRSRKDGLIINISSWAGRYASPLTGPAYNATKRAVIAVTESINIEECRNGIRATSILPGEVATPIMEKRPVPPPPQERARM